MGEDQRNSKGFYAAIHVVGIESDSHGDDTDELRFRYAIQLDGSGNFAAFAGM